MRMAVEGGQPAQLPPALKLRQSGLSCNNGAQRKFMSNGSIPKASPVAVNTAAFSLSDNLL